MAALLDVLKSPILSVEYPAHSQLPYAAAAVSATPLLLIEGGIGAAILVSAIVGALFVAAMLLQVATSVKAGLPLRGIHPRHFEAAWMDPLTRGLWVTYRGRIRYAARPPEKVSRRILKHHGRSRIALRPGRGTTVRDMAIWAPAVAVLGIDGLTPLAWLVLCAALSGIHYFFRGEPIVVGTDGIRLPWRTACVIRQRFVSFSDITRAVVEGQELILHRGPGLRPIFAGPLPTAAGRFAEGIVTSRLDAYRGAAALTHALSQLPGYATEEITQAELTETLTNPASSMLTRLAALTELRTRAPAIAEAVVKAVRSRAANPATKRWLNRRA